MVTVDWENRQVEHPCGEMDTLHRQITMTIKDIAVDSG